MRVGIDARITHYSRGGIRNYVMYLIDALAAIDSSTEYYVLHSRKDQAPPAAGPNFRPVACFTPPHHRWEKWAFGAEIERLRLDVLHSTDFIPPAFGYKCSVITIHDLSFLHYAQFLTDESRRYYNYQIHWAAKRADCILADSRATQSDIASLLDVSESKITVAHLAAHTRFKPMPSADSARVANQYGLSPGYLLFVGTLEPRKNLPGLLEAYRILLDKGMVSVPLVIVGSKGWLYGQTYERLNELDLRNHIAFIHDVPDHDLPALYNAATLLIAPSFYEGFGLPALEAMACGTPVVVADRASLPEIVGEAGVLVNPEDPKDIADGMIRLLKDKKLYQCMQAAGPIQAATFSWGKTAERTLAVYREALKGKGIVP